MPEPPLVVQVTATLVTFAEPTVPVPPLTVQVCPDGWVRTVTEYAAPLASFVGNVKEPLAVTERLSPPLSCSTTVPASPDTVPPTEYVGGRGGRAGHGDAGDIRRADGPGAAR